MEVPDGAVGMIELRADNSAEVEGSAEFVSAPGVLLLGSIGLDMVGWRCRRKTTHNY